MTSGELVKKLKALRKRILADDKVDWDETNELLAFLRPLAAKHDFMFEDFEHLIKKAQQDSIITEEESNRIALHLDYLCGFFANARLKAILMTIVGIGIIGAVIFVFLKVKASLGV